MRTSAPVRRLSLSSLAFAMSLFAHQKASAMSLEEGNQFWCAGGACCPYDPSTEIVSPHNCKYNCNGFADGQRAQYEVNVACTGVPE